MSRPMVTMGAEGGSAGASGMGVPFTEYSCKLSAH